MSENVKNEFSIKCNCKSSFIWGFVIPVGLIVIFVMTFFVLIEVKSKGGRPEFGSPALILGLLVLPIVIILVFGFNGFGLYRIFRSDCPNKMRVLIPNGILFLSLIGAVLYLLAVITASKVFG